MDNRASLRTRSSLGPTCAFVQFGELTDLDAHTIHILAMCDALTTAGVDTELFVHPPVGVAIPNADDLRGRYGLDNTPRISWIPENPNRWLARVRVIVESFRAGRDSTYAYTTRALPALGALLGGNRHVFFEIHQPIPARHDRVALRIARRSERLHVVCISGQLAEMIARQYGFESSALIVEHSGHSFPIRDDYRANPAKGHRLRAMYVGSFIPGKGITTVLELAERHPAVDFVVVGGQAPQGHLPGNVTVHAPVPHADVPELLSQADVLLMPLTMYTGGDGESSEEFYSPLKMVEYLSAGRSIIASSLPSIAEVLVHESNCLLAGPDSIEEWSEAMRRLENDAELRLRLAHAAAETAKQHTMLGRVHRILAHAGAVE
jgi:glycosyltransferase involved in cell wall biosynthesis